jgi:hypothetical protein
VVEEELGDLEESDADDGSSDEAGHCQGDHHLLELGSEIVHELLTLPVEVIGADGWALAVAGVGDVAEGEGGVLIGHLVWDCLDGIEGVAEVADHGLRWHEGFAGVEGLIAGEGGGVLDGGLSEAGVGTIVELARRGRCLDGWELGDEVPRSSH